MLEIIQARLQVSPAFSSVEVAESLEALAAGSVTAANDKTVFVVPWRERARPQRNIIGGHRQTIDVQFVTVLVLRRHDDPLGAARAKAFDTIKADLEALLAGWQPSEGSDSISLAAGETQGLGNGVSILTQTWSTTRFLTGAQT